MMRAKSGKGVLFAAIAFVLLVIAATAYATVPSRDLSASDVVDSASGRRYLTQEIQRFLPQDGKTISGDFGYAQVAYATFAEFEQSRGVVTDAWDSDQPAFVTLLTFSSPSVRFALPRPRAGFDETVPGAFVLFVLPTGVQTVDIVSDAAYTALRASAGLSLEQLDLAAQE